MLTEPKMTKFALLNNNGEAKTNLTTEEAAKIVLYDDGRDYEIRPDDDFGFRLWIRKQVANIDWYRSAIYSINDDAIEAETDIFRQVIAECNPLSRGYFWPMPMADYEEMSAP